MKTQKKTNGIWTVTLRLSVMVPLLVVACTADPPIIGQYDGKNGKKDLMPWPDWPPSCKTATQVGPPVLDTYPNPTSYALQAFRGRCPGAQTMTAKAGGTTAAPVKVSSDGKFCIEVQLLPDSPNTVTFTGLDANGCPGKETQIPIQHRSAARQDAGISVPVNVALKAPVSSSPNPEGELSSVNDGDENSAAKFSFWDPDVTGTTCDANAWVRIDLGKVYTITKVKIRWAPNAGDDFAKCYAVLASALPGPGDPSTSNTAWKTVKQDQNNTDTSQILFTLGSGSDMYRWFALLMYENNSTHAWEYFNLAEFEVWGQDPNAFPTPPPDRCQ